MAGAAVDSSSEGRPAAGTLERQRARLRTIREGAAFWGEHGAATPAAVRWGYVAKAAVFAVLAVGITAVTTPELGGLDELGAWWREPAFFAKAVVWALLFEVLGLGCSAGPLTQRITPLIGGVLYWLRPGTLRLPRELRLIALESQPLHRQRQHYRIVDAATGLVEQGHVAVRDMAARQPWLSEDEPAIPVQAR